VSGPFEVENCRIGGLTDVVLDKTSTVTTGKPALTVVDEESPSLSAGCTPTSGSTFPIGTTPVTCTVTDRDDTASPVSHDNGA
jgi:hypothetical protein